MVTDPEWKNMDVGELWNACEDLEDRANDAEARLAAVIALCDDEAARVQKHNANPNRPGGRNIVGILSERKVRAAARESGGN